MSESLKEFLNGFGGRVVVMVAGGLATTFSGWAAGNLASLQNELKDLHDAVVMLQTADAVRNSSSFTTADWMRENKAIQDRFHQSDLRLAQVDGAVKSIRESLDRIERTLGTRSP